MNFRPIKNRILVLPKAQKTKTESGIIVPDGAEDVVAKQGTIIKVGKEVNTTEFDVDSQILFSKYADKSLTLDGVEYLLIVDEDIYGVID